MTNRQRLGSGFAVVVCLGFAFVASQRKAGTARSTQAVYRNEARPAILDFAPAVTLRNAAVDTAARDREADRQARFAEIGQALREIPEVDPESIRELADGIRAERNDLDQLRAALAEADRNLAQASAAAAADRNRELGVAQQISGLQRQLADAKIQVAEQKQWIEANFYSDDAEFMAGLNRELIRRGDRVTELEARIDDLFAQELDTANRTAARLAILRNEQARLLARIREANGALASDEQAYREIMTEIRKNHLRAGELNQELEGL